jgi:hypothetical protein
VLNRQVAVNTMAEVTALGTAMLAAGGELPRAVADTRQREYSPLVDMSAFLERFAMAVTRASHWRQ